MTGFPPRRAAVSVLAATCALFTAAVAQAQQAPPAPPANAAPAPAASDELHGAGYIPGYRPDPSISLSPYVPRTPAPPGGVTPSYGAPMPPEDWTFRWTGFLTASLQTSENTRVLPTAGQSKVVFHAPPQTVDAYGSFVGTNTVPGQWAQLNFVYGNRYVSANVSLTTWNPDQASTFYQIGSQQFLNNMFLTFSPKPILGVRLHALVGYFYNTYGAIAQYGLGMYTNPLIGGVRGVGEDLIAEYDVSDTLTVKLEDGVMGNRNGMGAINIIPSGQNGNSPILFPSAWIHHLHAGFEKRGDWTIHGGLHYLTNWAQDDRAQTGIDNPQTRQINEAYVPDGRVQTYGADIAFLSPVLGYLGAAVSYTTAENAYPVKGLVTFGGDGESLTNNWFGELTGGNGQLLAAGVNYTASLGRILSYPVPFNTDGPDLVLNTGVVIAESWNQPSQFLTSSSSFADFDGRLRYKFGADLLYSFLPFAAAGFRADMVAPNSHDSEETFYVLSPRLVFKSDWGSRDTISLIYGKWFYGPHTHAEGSTITPGDRLDDQLFAINAQMWW